MSTTIFKLIIKLFVILFICCFAYITFLLFLFFFHKTHNQSLTPNPTLFAQEFLGTILINDYYPPSYKWKNGFDIYSTYWEVGKNQFNLDIHVISNRETFASLSVKNTQIKNQTLTASTSASLVKTYFNSKVPVDISCLSNGHLCQSFYTVKNGKLGYILTTLKDNSLNIFACFIPVNSKYYTYATSCLFAQ